MAAINHLKWLVRPLIWAIVLGFVGFIFGAMGQPLLLADPSNVAILWGFIIGPKGFVVGALLGGLSVLLHLNTKQNLYFLAVAAIVAAVVAIYLTVAGYRPTVDLVDAEIIGCE